MPKDPQQAVIDAILNKGRTGAQAARPRQERQRESKPYVRSPPAVDGAWTHDLYRGALEDIGREATRAGRGGQARTVRVQGDLLDSRPAARRQQSEDKMRGFGADAERRLQTQTQQKQAVELLPGPSRPAAPQLARRLVPAKARRQADLIPGLDDDAPMQDEEVVPSRAQMPAFGVKGMAKVDEGPTRVVIEGLLNGTTEDDVKSAFADHVTIQSARMLPSPASSPTISTELVVATRAEALAMIEKFNGVVADGTPLKLYTPAPAPVPAPGPPRLSDRLSSTSVPRRDRPESAGGLFKHAMGSTVGATPVRSVDLLASGSSGKMYSDTILKQDQTARIITVAEQDAQSRRNPRPATRGGRGRGAATAGGRGAQDLLSRLGVKA